MMSMKPDFIDFNSVVHPDAKLQKTYLFGMSCMWKSFEEKVGLLSVDFVNLYVEFWHTSRRMGCHFV